MNAEPDDKKSLRRDLGLALLVAFLFRFIFLLAMRRVIDMPDAIHYIAMARQFAAGDFLGFDENLPILYPLLGALAHLVLPDWEWAFWAVSLVSSTLLVVPVYLLAHALHGRTSARIATTVVCVWPWLVDYAGRIAPESLAVLLWFLAIWLLYRAIRNGGPALIAAPIAFFALHLARPEGTFIMLAAPLGALFLSIRRDREHLTRLILFAALCAGLLLLYAAAMRLAIGTWTLSYRAPMAGDVIPYFRRGAIEFARTFVRLLANLLPIMLGPFLLVFIGVGLFHPTHPSEPRRKLRLEALILFFCAVQWALTLANFSPAPRYIMVVVVALSLWSARGVAAVARQAAEMPRARWLKWAPLAVVLLPMFAGLAMNILPEYLGLMPGIPREYKIAGRWMNEHLEPGLILSRKPQVGYYANMPTTGPAADDTPAAAIERATAIGARYLVFDERYSAQIVPGLRPLLDPERAPPELKLLRDDLSPYPGAAIVIYQVVTPGIRYLTPEEFPQVSSFWGPDERRRKTPAPEE